jgi:glutamate--cysteine ligase
LGIDKRIVPADRPPLSRRAVVEHLATHDATPTAGPPRLGIEQEWHTYRVAEPGRHLEPAEVLDAVAAGGPLPHGGCVTVEPGGQVELATSAVSPWWEVLDALRTDGLAVRAALADRGIGVVAAGTDPFRSPKRTLAAPRYDAMEAYFEPWAPAGRTMMSGCASIQVNLDHGSTEELSHRWALAHHIGPALSAAFACSPSRTHRSARLGAWWRLDPSRTSPALASGVMADDWAAYVLRAQVMLLHDDDERCVPVTTPITFAEWVEHGIDGRFPTEDDLAYHCTTLFPPERPRGWLELRWLDSLPDALAAVAIATVVTVLTDDDAAAQAAVACAPVARSWEQAAAHGPAHPGLARAATSVLCAAAEALERTGAPGALAAAVADAAARWPGRGRCPADDLEGRLRHGATLTDVLEPGAEVLQWT